MGCRVGLILGIVTQQSPLLTALFPQITYLPPEPVETLSGYSFGRQVCSPPIQFDLDIAQKIKTVLNELAPNCFQDGVISPFLTNDSSGGNEDIYDNDDDEEQEEKDVPIVEDCPNEPPPAPSTVLDGKQPSPDRMDTREDQDAEGDADEEYIPPPGNTPMSLKSASPSEDEEVDQLEEEEPTPPPRVLRRNTRRSICSPGAFSGWLPPLFLPITDHPFRPFSQKFPRPPSLNHPLRDVKFL